jgi:hypothetical protein
VANGCSRGTTFGMIDWAAVSNSVSPTPRTNATTYRTGSETTSATIPAASPTATTIRRSATEAIVRRRSSRSASAPATSTKPSHGSRHTTLTPATRAGESVSWIAYSGRAIQKIPSARFDAAEADQSRQ